ncbi:hypothetical protein PRUPE_1G497300 [Prunus persica]|uniref:Esterase n=1 Tax=Prunus persica TaxID=3760 RepID=A0A251RFL9_PRUPE|nr:esterase [Prunus persica]ONI34762.1 hypothetical protein PRUPE_1G497300 [Prunus persica]
MESPRITIKVIISLFCSYMLLSHYITTLSPALALEDCHFPAIFNFGDSNSDTGGMAAAIYRPPPPSGKTHFHTPAGRFSDGRLIIDFLAKSLGHPFLSAYLDSIGTNFSHGANFATASSTIRLPDPIIPAPGGFSPFTLNIQCSQFLQLKSRSQLIRHRGGIFASLMPKKKYFAKALYTFDIGQNDLPEGFFGNLTVQEVNASVPNIVSTFSANIKKIYDSGGRSFWIHNTGPIGCIPYILVNFPAQKDEVGCAKLYNEVAQYFNHKLKEATVQLRKDLPLAAITYVDIYSVKYSLYKEPQKYRFEQPLVSCCGTGGKYNFNSKTVECGRTVTVNGRQIFADSCKRPYVKVNWDGIHYTDAAAKIIFDKISTGAFSDPPLPLKQACHRSLE